MDNQWTLDTLLTHLQEKISDIEIRTDERFNLSKIAVDAALAASEKAINAAMAAAEKAVSKAEIASEKRFDAVNEFRETLTDQQITFARKDTVDFQIKAINDKLDAIILQNSSSISTHLGFNSAWVLFLGGTTLIATAIAAAFAFAKMFGKG